MNLPLKRFAAVLLTVCVLGVAAGTVYAAGRGQAPQSRPQSQPKPQPKPQPQPKPAQQQKASPSVSVIGSIGSGSSIGSIGSGSTIGSIGSGSSIGSLSSGSMIGTLNTGNQMSGTKPNEFLNMAREQVKQSKQAEKAAKEAKKKLPQIEQQVREQVEPMIPQIEQQVREQVEPMIPQIREVAQQAAQQIRNEPAVQQIIQENPQIDRPIIITPQSSRNGNASRRRGTYHDTPGYSGGDGSGPLIYNP